MKEKKYLIGQQYREYISPTDYIVYTIVKLTGGVATVTVEDSKSNPILPESLGYFPESDDEYKMTIFAHVLEYCDYVGMRNKVKDLKRELMNCIALENYERCAEIRDELSEMGELEKVVSEI